jgi:hypothetical protein
MTEVLDIPFLATGGKIPADVWRRLGETVARMEGKRLIVSLKEQKRRRSLNQNAYYWGCVLPPLVAMFREAGNNVDAEDVHSYLKEHVGKLKQIFVTSDGEILTGAGSTAKLSTVEMEVYLEKVRAWAAEHGVAIPLPNESVV